jgi:hypothetical protein
MIGRSPQDTFGGMFQISRTNVQDQDKIETRPKIPKTKIAGLVSKTKQSRPSSLTRGR